mmetsp:Transcript_32779/g.97785  ORF Transcript_32779/g.97785 Transcript_32779/m.97785 type:complete len:265 (-) Transcript_32779:28-822(-)
MGWTDRIPFIRQSSSPPPNPSWWPENEYVSLSPEIRSALADATALTPPQQALLAGCCAVSLAVGYRVGRLRSSARFTRLSSAADVPPSLVGPDAPFLRGRAISVSDGDTLRFLHVPTALHSSHLADGEKMSNVAMPVRVCTVDAPETAKFGKNGQPFGDDAKEYLTNMVGDRMVDVRLLQKDQYGRAVAEVRYGVWPFRKYVDERMLEVGLAEVYQGGGAVYGRLGKERYLEIEDRARNKTIGMWSLKERESAAEYKARIKAGG